jgi:acyl carrier protein
MVSIEERIRTYIAENILFTGNEYGYPDEASFLREGIVSSTNLLELILFAEEAYGISVDDHDVVPDNFDSVAKLAAFIRRKL